MTVGGIELACKALSKTKNHSSQVRPSAINMGTFGGNLYECERQKPISSSSGSGVVVATVVLVVPVQSVATDGVVLFLINASHSCIQVSSRSLGNLAVIAVRNVATLTALSVSELMASNAWLKVSMT